jgi:hypothetical protein
MDNRGSKSVLNIYNTVKEQRADGYRYLYYSKYLRCALVA